MPRLAATLLAASLGALAGCSQTGSPPMAATVCELSRYPQRLVQVQAEVRLRSDGQAVLSDAGCATERIELRLTGAATTAGLEAALKAALDAGGADAVHVPVAVSGVYAGPPENHFTAESLVIQSSGR